ncbi:hypothetical protein OsI_15632 [Oryza sativa Indica Group]|uniref:Uncharacterized protein n=1 Tax=Oryza sativa subsp. indica TaxID=39946 RepID=B8AT64_ORYSI|nr:hypothetical protein OsI_15632 [Oryza sativa Indica Group]
MARNAATACSTLLLLIAAATTLLVPAASAAKLVAGKDAATATAAEAALGSTVAPWVEADASGVIGGMMMVAAAAGSVEYGHGGVHHRRVLQARGGGNVNPSLVADRQRCIGSCPARGGSYTGRGNQCIYHNRSC